MPLFDRYIAVDWSAANVPKRGKDSIWIGEATRAGLVPSVNPPTRHAAMRDLAERLERALSNGERCFVGLDFPFGYPAGAAERLSGGTDWSALWTSVDAAVQDGEDNRSNRFAVATAFNLRLGGDGPRFWGCPAQQASVGLNTRKAGIRFDAVAEFRAVERVARGAKSTWQLFYNGSVGSQCLLGIARLQKLRQRFGDRLAIWPFETDFERRLGAPIVFAEIYPSLQAHDPDVTPKDRAQVEAQVRRFAALDAADDLGRMLSLPSAFVEQREMLLREEGWIVGAGHAEHAA